jgi:hypothetical protein
MCYDGRLEKLNRLNEETRNYNNRNVDRFNRSTAGNYNTTNFYRLNNETYRYNNGQYNNYYTNRH